MSGSLSPQQIQTMYARALQDPNARRTMPGVDPRLFVPAMRLNLGGRPAVLQGKMGELHEDLVDRFVGPNDENMQAYQQGKPELGFVNITNGRFHTRDQAARAIGVEEAADLAKLQRPLR